jgi:hypothetical protein
MIVVSHNACLSKMGNQVYTKEALKMKTSDVFAWGFWLRSCVQVELLVAAQEIPMGEPWR